MITLYDIPSSLPNKAWSPNVWRTRCVLPSSLHPLLFRLTVNPLP